MKTTILVMLLAASLQAQGFSRFVPVPSRSDRDFKVQQSASGGPELKIIQQPDGSFIGIDPSLSNLRFKVSFYTSVRGKGKLTALKLNPDDTALLTVEGLQDHAVWLVLMNRTSVEMGAKFWHIGDVIYLNTNTIIPSYNDIPKVQNSEGSTVNTTRNNCDQRGCWNGKVWEQ